MNDVVFRNGTKPWTIFDLMLQQSRPYQVTGSCAGGSNNFLTILSALNATFFSRPGGSKESRKMAEALVLPAFLLMQLRQLSPCFFSSSFLIATARRCLAIGSSGKVKAAPMQSVGKAFSFKFRDKFSSHYLWQDFVPARLEKCYQLFPHLVPIIRSTPPGWLCRTS